MALDGLTCSLLAKELNDQLTGARIDKIFQPDKYTIFMHIRSSQGNMKLLISFNPSAPRLHLTKTTRENPTMPPSFCMLLRKYCSGAKISSITCPDYERIIEISFLTTDELHDIKEMKLVIELMGRYSNCILVNPNGRIIDSAIHVDFSVSRVREVMPARLYEYPPNQEKNNATTALDILNNGELPILESEINRPVAKGLLNSIKGFSPLIVNQICLKADIENNKPLKTIDEEEKSRLISTLKSELLKVINQDISPIYCLTEDNEAKDFCYTNLEGFNNVYSCNSISEAIDEFYCLKESNIDFENKRQALLSIVNNALVHASKKYEIHNSDFEEGQKAEVYKKKGDILLCFAYMIKNKDTSITCQDIYDDLGRDITIALDPSLNATDNAQEYFKKFHKAKRKLELSLEYLEDDKNAIEYLRSLKTAINSASSDEDLVAIKSELTYEASFIKKEKKQKHINNPIDPNKTVGVSKSGKASSRALRAAAQKANQKQKKNNSSIKETSTYRKYTSSDGHQIYCGRNNIQNDQLTFKIANKEDWWFHIKGLPGTHVILVKKPYEDMPSDSSIEEAAQIAAYFSRSTIIDEHMNGEGSKSGQIKAEVDYCPVSHVKKIPKAKPGMVIYEGYYSINVTAKEPKNE